MNKEDRAQGAGRATERAKLRPALKAHDPPGRAPLTPPGSDAFVLSGNKSWS